MITATRPRVKELESRLGEHTSEHAGLGLGHADTDSGTNGRIQSSWRIGSRLHRRKGISLSDRLTRLRVTSLRLVALNSYLLKMSLKSCEYSFTLAN